MEIYAGHGIENVCFGMSENEVVQSVGFPNKTYKKNIDSDSNSIVYHYNELMIILEFNEEYEFKLYSISVYFPDINLFQNNLYSKSKHEIISFLNSKEFYNLESESYDSFDVIYCDNLNMSFNFEFDRLISIEFWPLFSDEDNIAWPIK